MGNFIPSEKPVIEADGIIHRRPADPEKMQIVKVFYGGLFVVGLWLLSVHVGLALVVLGFVVVCNLFGMGAERLTGDCQINMCPRCHHKTSYSQYQVLCGQCGYVFRKGKEDEDILASIGADRSSAKPGATFDPCG